VNCPSLDFDDAEGRHAQQQLELAAEQLGTRLPVSAPRRRPAALRPPNS